MEVKTVKKALAIGLVAFASAFAMQANAAPIFSFTQFGGFEDVLAVADYSNAISGTASQVPATTPLYSTMSWASGTTPQSSLVLDTVDTQTALAANVWTTISTLTHNNFLIPFAVNWTGQNIWGRLKIMDADGGSSVRLDDTSVVSISLTETLNNAPCSSPTPLGSTCDDFFTFDNVGLGNLFFTANDNSQWMASFRFANFVNSAFVDGIIYTAEATSSSLDVQVMLTNLAGPPSSVPEPATLGILGLGLVGLSVMKRRKQNA